MSQADLGISCGSSFLRYANDLLHFSYDRLWIAVSPKWADCGRRKFDCVLLSIPHLPQNTIKQILGTKYISLFPSVFLISPRNANGFAAFQEIINLNWEIKWLINCTIRKLVGRSRVRRAKTMQRLSAWFGCSLSRQRAIYSRRLSNANSHRSDRRFHTQRLRVCSLSVYSSLMFGDFVERSRIDLTTVNSFFFGVLKSHLKYGYLMSERYMCFLLCRCCNKWLEDMQDNGCRAEILHNSKSITQ